MMRAVSFKAQFFQELGPGLIFLAFLAFTVQQVEASMPDTLDGYVQWGPFREVVALNLSRTDSNLLAKKLRVDRDSFVPKSLRGGKNPFSAVGDAAAFVHLIVDAVKPYLARGEAVRVERLLAVLSERKLFMAMSNYEGLLEASLSLRIQPPDEYEVRAFFRPPAQKDQPKGEGDFKGISIDYPTGVHAQPPPVREEPPLATGWLSNT